MTSAGWRRFEITWQEPLAQMMGGDAQVSSAPGVGSEFLVTLPLVEADEDLVAQATRTKRPIEVADCP